MQDNELYTVLQLPVFSSIEDVKRAFRKLALSQHPDKANTSNNFDIPVHAHGILSKQESKHNYDLILRARLSNNELQMEPAFKERSLNEVLRITTTVKPKPDKYRLLFAHFLLPTKFNTKNDGVYETLEKVPQLNIEWRDFHQQEHPTDSCHAIFSNMVIAGAAKLIGGDSVERKITETACYLLGKSLSKKMCAKCYRSWLLGQTSNSMINVLSRLMAAFLLELPNTTVHIINNLRSMIDVLHTQSSQRFICYMTLLGKSFQKLCQHALRVTYHIPNRSISESDFRHMPNNAHAKKFEAMLAKGTLSIQTYLILASQKKIQQELRCGSVDAIAGSKGGDTFRNIAFDYLYRNITFPLAEVGQVSNALFACAILKFSLFFEPKFRYRFATEMVMLIVCKHITNWCLQLSSSWFVTYACVATLRFVNSLSTIQEDVVQSLRAELELHINYSKQGFCWFPEDHVLDFFGAYNQFVHKQKFETEVTALLSHDSLTCQKLFLHFETVLSRNHKFSLLEEQKPVEEDHSETLIDDQSTYLNVDQSETPQLWNIQDDQRMALIESFLKSMNWTLLDYVANFDQHGHFVAQNQQRFWSLGNDVNIPSQQFESDAKLYTEILGFEFQAMTGKLSLVLTSFDSEKHMPWQLSFSSADIKEIFALAISSSSFSLDPLSKRNQYVPFQKMVFSPERIVNTKYLRAQFVADYWLKALTNGATVQMAPPFRTRKLDFNILPDGLKSILDNYHQSNETGLNRFWIECAQIPSLDESLNEIPIAHTNMDEERARTHLKFTFGEPVMIVQTRRMNWVDGKLQDVNNDVQVSPWDIFLITDLAAFEHHVQQTESIIRSIAIELQMSVSLTTIVRIWFYEHGQVSKFFKTVEIPNHFRSLLSMEQSQSQNDFWTTHFHDVDKCKLKQIKCNDSQLFHEFVEFLCRACKRCTYYSASEQLAFQMTKYYDTFAQYFPSWNRLKQLAKLVAIVRELQNMREHQHEQLHEALVQKHHGVVSNIKKVLNNIQTVVPEVHNWQKQQEALTLPPICNFVPAVQLRTAKTLTVGGVRLVPTLRTQCDVANLIRSASFPFASAFSIASTAKEMSRLSNDLRSTCAMNFENGDTSQICNLIRDLENAQKYASNINICENNWKPPSMQCGQAKFDNFWEPTSVPSQISPPIVPTCSKAMSAGMSASMSRSSSMSANVFTTIFADMFAGDECTSSDMFADDMCTSSNSHRNITTNYDFLNQASSTQICDIHSFFNPFSSNFIYTSTNASKAAEQTSTPEKRQMEAETLLKTAKETWNTMVNEVQDIKHLLASSFPSLASRPPEPSQYPPAVGVVPRRSTVRPESKLQQELSSKWNKRSIMKDLGPGKATYSFSREPCGSLMVDLEYIVAEIGKTAGRRKYATIGENPPKQWNIEGIFVTTATRYGKFQCERLLSASTV